MYGAKLALVEEVGDKIAMKKKEVMKFVTYMQKARKFFLAEYSLMPKADFKMELLKK